jgi:iron(III) transport system permease protein
VSTVRLGRLGRPGWAGYGVLLAAALVVGLVGLPLARLVAILVSAGTGPLRRVVTAPGFGSAVAHSLEVALAVTAIAVCGGAAAALATARPGTPGRRWLRVAVLLPLLVPQFVLGYSWTQAYGRSGFSDQVLGVTLPGLFGPAGVIVVTAVNVLPLAYLVVAASLSARAEPDLVRAARAAGADAVTAFRTVTLPLLRAPLGAAAALVFVTALESFAVPAVLGIPAGFATMTTRIYSDLALASDPDSFTDAITLSLALVLVAVIVLVPADRLFGVRGRPIRSGGSAGAVPTRNPGRSAWLATAALWAYLAVAVGLPLVALVLASITRAVGLTPVPSNWTLANFSQALSGPTVPALLRSLLLALAAASILVAAGGLVAALERRRFGRSLPMIVMLAFALPGSALAVGMLLAYGRWLRDTLLLILLACLAKLWPFGHRPISGAVDRLPPDDLRAARVSGARTITAIRTVVLRPLSPALAGAWLLIFLVVLHELTMSSLLYGPSSETLAVVVLNQQQLGDVGVTAALAVLLGLLLVVAALPLLVWSRVRRSSGARRHAPVRAEAGVSGAA